MSNQRPANKLLPPTAAKVLYLVGLTVTALLWPRPAVAQNPKGNGKGQGGGGGIVITPQVCNPAIGCTAGDPPSVWFTNPQSGTTHSNALISDVVHFCDDGGLNLGTRVITRNGTALSNSGGASGYSGCWQHASYSFSYTPVPGNNTIFASIKDNFGQLGSLQYSFFYDTLLVAVTPDNAAHSKPTVTPVADTFTVQNYGTATVTYNLTVTCSNAGSLNCSAPSSVEVSGGSTSPVIVSYRTRGWNSVDTISLRATTQDGHQSDAGSVIETASLNAASASFAANNEDNQQLGLCANACFTATMAHGTASYRSLGTDRSVALAYHGDRTAVRPYVSADVSLPSGAGMPSEVRLQASVNGNQQTFLNNEQVLHFSTAGWQGGKTYRLAGQLDLSSLVTNMYPLLLTATAVYADHSEIFTSPSSLKMMVVNLRTSSTILPTVGWTVAGIQQLFRQTDGTMLIVEGDGSGVYFDCTSHGSVCAGPSGDFTTLDSTGSGASLRYTRRYPNTSQVVFDNVGHMLQSIDRWGNTSNVTYDGSNRISTIGDPILASYFQFTYGAGLFTIKLPRPNGGTPADTRGTTVTYDGSGHLTSFTDADQGTTQLAYDGSGRLASVQDRLQGLTTYYYDASSWKLDSIALPAVPIDGQGQPQSPTVRMRGWQRVGVPTTSTSGTFATAPMLDTIYGRSIGAISDETKFTADRWGQPLTVIDALGNTTAIVRTGIFASSVTNPLGQTDSYGYTNGFLTSKTPYGQPTTYISYDSWGMPSQISGGNAPTINRSFDDVHRTITTTVGGAYASTDSLDSRGRVFASVDPANHASRYHYDGIFGNLDSTLAAAGQWTRTRLDGYGRDSALTALGHPTVVRHIYDILGRDSLTYDGVHAQPVKYTYNALYLTIVRDQSGQVYKQDVNALGWPTVIYDPADTISWTRKQSFKYDVGGRITTMQNRRGIQVRQQWDKLGRLTSQRDSLGTADSLSYSANGRTIVASNAVSVDSLMVGDRGADTVVTRIVGQSYWFRRVHSGTEGTTSDTTFLTSSLAAGILQNRMNFWSQSRGVLDSVLVGTRSYRVGYTNELMPDTLNYSGSMLRIDSLTSIHQVYARHYSASAVDGAASRAYAYDSLGRISVESEPSPAAGSTILRSYGYAGTGAVQWYKGTLISPGFSCGLGYGCSYTGATVTNTWTKYGFGYDDVNNLTSQVDSLNGNALISGTFNTGNRLASWGTDNYTYDSDGNRGTHGSTTYTWSSTGRLLSVTNGASSVEYAYNGLGELVRRKTNGLVDRYFIWDNGELLLLLDGGANRIAEYAYMPEGEPLSITTGAAFAYTTYYYNTDLRGNVVGVNDGLNVLQQINYGPWGNVENQNGFAFDTTRLGWKANVWEGGITSLYYVHNRWYDPASRSFISEDPVGIAGGLNTYSYSDNDAVNYSDPLGLWRVCLILCIGNGAKDGECYGAFWSGLFGIGVCGSEAGGDGGGGDPPPSPPPPRLPQFPGGPDPKPPSRPMEPSGHGGPVYIPDRKPPKPMGPLQSCEEADFEGNSGTIYVRYDSYTDRLIWTVEMKNPSLGLWGFREFMNGKKGEGDLRVRSMLHSSLSLKNVPSGSLFQVKVMFLDARGHRHRSVLNGCLTP